VSAPTGSTSRLWLSETVRRPPLGLQGKGQQQECRRTRDWPRNAFPERASKRCWHAAFWDTAADQGRAGPAGWGMAAHSACTAGSAASRSPSASSAPPTPASRALSPPPGAPDSVRASSGSGDAPPLDASGCPGLAGGRPQRRAYRSARTRRGSRAGGRCRACCPWRANSSAMRWRGSRASGTEVAMPDAGASATSAAAGGDAASGWACGGPASSWPSSPAPTGAGGVRVGSPAGTRGDVGSGIGARAGTAALVPASRPRSARCRETAGALAGEAHPPQSPVVGHPHPLPTASPVVPRQHAW